MEAIQKDALASAGVITVPSPSLEWEQAKQHFDEVRQQYQELEGKPGVNTTLALRAVFDPLAKRFNSGERTAALHKEMMEVQ